MGAAATNDKQFLLHQITWMGIYVAIGFAISLTLLFPLSLVGALGAFLFLSDFIRTRKMLKRSGIDMKGLFRSLSSASLSSIYREYNPLKYYCMSCGKEHKTLRQILSSSLY
jgi:hypothetical protein